MKSILNFREFVNENLNEESFADFNKSSGFKMDSKAKSTLKKLNVNPTKLKDAFDDYSKIMKYLDSNGKKIGTVSIPNPGSKSNPEFMYTVYDTDMYGKVLTGDGDSVFVEMVKESLNEASYSMNIGNAKEDKIAREYGASQIAQMDTDDEKYQELGLKFKYITDGESLEEYDKTFDDLIKSLKKARLKFVKIDGGGADGMGEIVF